MTDALAKQFDLDLVTLFGVAGHEFDGPICAGKVAALGFGTAMPSCGEVASFLAGLAEDAKLKDVLAVVLAIDVAAASAVGVAAVVAAVAAAREALMVGMRDVIDTTPLSIS